MYRTDNLSQLLVIYKMTVHVFTHERDLILINLYTILFSFMTIHVHVTPATNIWFEKLTIRFIRLLLQWKNYDLTTIIGVFSVPYGFTIRIECLLRFIKTMHNLCVFFLI